MKPTKNQVFCLSCQHNKMLFESQKKADRFIAFNGNEILEETGRAPVRSYYCLFCCGWHVTSNPSQTDAQKLDERDQQKAGRLEKWKQDKNVALEIKEHGSAALSGQLDEIQRLLLSFAEPEAEWLLEKTMKKLRFVMKFYPRWQAGLKMTRRGHALQSVVHVLHHISSDPENVNDVIQTCEDIDNEQILKQLEPVLPHYARLSHRLDQLEQQSQKDIDPDYICEILAVKFDIMALRGPRTKELKKNLRIRQRTILNRFVDALRNNPCDKTLVKPYLSGVEWLIAHAETALLQSDGKGCRIYVDQGFKMLTLIRELPEADACHDKLNNLYNRSLNHSTN